MKLKIKKLKSKMGMTLFIAVVVMGILLFISFAVVNIAIKSTLFSSLGRDSQYAFYAADSGIECAIYWDSKFDPSYFDITAKTGPISCGGMAISDGAPIPDGSTTQIGGSATSKFYFNMNNNSDPVPYCAIVTITKNALDGSTTIKSRGYNTCDTSNPRRVERGIEVTY
jgi:hypothetical protein